MLRRRHTYLLLLLGLITCGCGDRIMVKYVEGDVNEPFVYNSWYKFGDTYWFSTPSGDLARAEFTRITKHEADTIPLHRYGFSLWTDGSMYYVTQSKRK